MFEAHGGPLLRMLTDRGTEFCGRHDEHAYELFLALNDIDHTRTKVKHPQTNGICERFHKTILQEFYQVTFRKKVYRTLEELQEELDSWILRYNEQRTHQGKMCRGRTPLETFLNGMRIWRMKQLGEHAA
jgi:transposase InsO family protein